MSRSGKPVRRPLQSRGPLMIKHSLGSLLAGLPSARRPRSADPRRRPTPGSELFAENYIEHSGRNPFRADGICAEWEEPVRCDSRRPHPDRPRHRQRRQGRSRHDLLRHQHHPVLRGHPRHGPRHHIRKIDFWRVENGKFGFHWYQVDFAGLQRQLTSKPASPQYAHED